MMNYIVVLQGGGIGSMARFGVVNWIGQRREGVSPWAHSLSMSREAFSSGS